MNLDDLFPSRYFKASDFEDGPRTFVMSHVEKQEMAQSKKKKPVVFFNEEDKGLVLNVTNGTTIGMAYGKGIAGWEGKPITLFKTTAPFGGKIVPCILVRIPQAGAERKQQELAQRFGDVDAANAELNQAADEQQDESVPFA